MSALDKLIERLTNGNEGSTLVDVKFFPGDSRHVSLEEFAKAADTVVSAIAEGQATLISAEKIDGQLNKVDVATL